MKRVQGDRVGERSRPGRTDKREGVKETERQGDGTETRD